MRGGEWERHGAAAPKESSMPAGRRAASANIVADNLPQQQLTSVRRRRRTFNVYDALFIRLHSAYHHPTSSRQLQRLVAMWVLLWITNNSVYSACLAAEWQRWTCTSGKFRSRFQCGTSHKYKFIHPNTQKAAHILMQARWVGRLCCFVLQTELHEALLRKNGKEFWKCWNSKTGNKYKNIRHVDGIADSATVAHNFAEHFKQICRPHKLTASFNENMKEKYEEMRS